MYAFPAQQVNLNLNWYDFNLNVILRDAGEYLYSAIEFLKVLSLLDAEPGQRRSEVSHLIITLKSGQKSPVMAPLTGHCLCKAVTYSLDVSKPDVVAYDHCDDCQRQSGSTYSLVTVVPKAKVRISGPIKSYAGRGSSGYAVHRIFCSQCGSPIAHDPDAAPDIIAIKAGTLDSGIKKNLKPDTEIWSVSKLPFCQEHLAHPFEHMPE